MCWRDAGLVSCLGLTQRCADISADYISYPAILDSFQVLGSEVFTAGSSNPSFLRLRENARMLAFGEAVVGCGRTEYRPH